MLLYSETVANVQRNFGRKLLNIVLRTNVYLVD